VYVAGDFCPATALGFRFATFLFSPKYVFGTHGICGRTSLKSQDPLAGSPAGFAPMTAASRALPTSSPPSALPVLLCRKDPHLRRACQPCTSCPQSRGKAP